MTSKGIWSLSEAYSKIKTGFWNYNAPAVGELWTWGSNFIATGALGTGSVASKPVPAMITGSNWTSFGIVATATEYATGFGLRVDNTLWTWGANSYGQIGDGTRTHRSSPVQVPGTWISVKSGNGNLLGIKSDATLWTWGANDIGQLGIGTAGAFANKSSPFQIPGAWKSIATSNSTPTVSLAGAIKTDGTLWMWGIGTDGGIGDGGTTTRSSPVQISGTNWSRLGNFGTKFGAAIRTDGTLWMWGRNTDGQLGQGDIVHRSSPVQIPGTWTDLVCSNSSTVGVRDDGSIWAWGKNGVGQLGQGDIVHRSSPVQIPGVWGSIIAKTEGFYGVSQNRVYYGWGDGTGNVLANGGSNASSPIQIYSSNWASMVSTIASGIGMGLKVVYTSSVLASGLWSWGKNSFGELGVGDIVHRSSPTQIPGTTWSYGTASYTSFTAFIRSDGTLWGWGENTIGELGQADRTNRSSPVQIPGTYINACVNGHNGLGAIRTDGTLWTIGYNGDGQLAQGDIVHRSSPVQVPGTNWLKVGAHYDGFACLRTDNTLWTWGSGVEGPLGQGNETPKSSPVQVPGVWVDVFVNNGARTVMALQPNGTLWAWGNNGSGRFGINNTTHVSSPVQIPGNWVSASGSALSAWFLTSTGYLWGSGSNANGQLGNSTVTNTSSMVSIGGGWAQIARSSNGSTTDSTGALKTDGSLWVWGSNTNGALGLGDLVHRSSPTQIPGTWYNINFGNNAGFGNR